MRALALVAALLMAQASSAFAQDTLITEVRTLSAAQDNDARFDALTTLLTAHKLPFVVETFSLPQAPSASGIKGADSRTRGRNVVVTLGDGAEVVVVGAHYDAKWLADRTLSKGAVDNGASSVMLIHVAEALRAERLSRRIKFVWFDFEESGLLGSAQYLESHQNDRVVAMLNYDINGYGDTVIYGPPMGGDDPKLRRLMAQTCAAEGVDCVRFDGMPPGDDRPFGLRQIPTLSIAILPAAEVHQLWLMLHAKNAGLAQGFEPAIFGIIHTPTDVPEKLDGASLTRAQRLATAVIRRAATSGP